MQIAAGFVQIAAGIVQIAARTVQIPASVVPSRAGAPPIGLRSHLDGGRMVLTPGGNRSIAGSRHLDGGSLRLNLMSLRRLCGRVDWIRGTEHFVSTVTTPTPLHYSLGCTDTVQRIDSGEMHAAGIVGRLERMLALA